MSEMFRQWIFSSRRARSSIMKRQLGGARWKSREKFTESAGIPIDCSLVKGPRGTTVGNEKCLINLGFSAPVESRAKAKIAKEGRNVVRKHG